ncbi:Fc.00g030730.m01.CDS01 [Cosmosporella sp. VM-42]
MAPPNPLEIQNFLSDYRTSQGERYVSASTPRYAPSIALSEDRSVTGRPRRRRSASSSSSATVRSSVFDTYDTRTVSSTSTAPPTYGIAQDHRPLLPPPQVLVCEFAGYSSCDFVFDLDDVDGWIEHIAIQHLRTRYPSYSCCWFCNSGKFQARSGKSTDLRACYWERMRHIAEHFRNGKTPDEIRPDFFFLDHIHHHGLIDDYTFQVAMSWHEGPQVDNIYPRGSLPTVQEEDYYAERSPPRERHRRRRDGSIVYL